MREVIIGIDAFALIGCSYFVGYLVGRRLGWDEGWNAAVESAATRIRKIAEGED